MTLDVLMLPFANICAVQPYHTQPLMQCISNMFVYRCQAWTKWAELMDMHKEDTSVFFLKTLPQKRRPGCQGAEQEFKWTMTTVLESPDESASQMALKEIARVLCRAPLLVFVLLPCITGVQLTINANTADYRLPTTPGRDQSLWCTAHNHTQEEELLWFRDDGRVNLKDGNQVNASNICVSPVTVDDNGVSFTCRLARNGSVQVSVVLDVRFLPILSGQDPPTVQEDRDVSIDCYVKANPPATMVWEKENSTLILDKDHYQVFQTSELFQLTIKNVKKSDSGAYTCVAESESRIVRQDFFLIVEDSRLAFPTEAVIAAAVVVLLLCIFAIVSRRKRIFKCFKRAGVSPSSTAL
ncbi:transmembrane and immunoglobulin domain-containing protein 1 [Tiliqua scincoides]|uniref:transmembrane and immunoglobulin domain-containing protein 1 n=1 Tax=Tiliqua scincoides TaxID=71010 RepID=UPI003461FA48